MKKILPSFSYIFHPIFIPAMATLFYLFYNSADYVTQEKFFVFFQVAIVTIIIPALVFLLLRASGNIDTIMISKISQRKIPLIVHSFLIILLTRKSITIDRYPELHFFFFGRTFKYFDCLNSIICKHKSKPSYDCYKFFDNFYNRIEYAS